MKICIVAYKFGTEQEIGEHLGSYHYFIEKMRRMVRLGHEVYIVAPWLSFIRKGSNEVEGVKILRYFPPLWNKVRLFPLNRIIRWWYFKATQQRVLDLADRVPLDIVYVWQARETGYAVAKISHKLKAPFVFRQITAWQWHFDRTTAEVMGRFAWYRVLAKVGFTKILNSIFEFLLDKKSSKKFAKLIYDKAKAVVFVSRAAAQEGIASGLPEEKVRVIGVGIETDLFAPFGQKKEWREKLKISGESVGLFIGRINFAEKGIGFLIQATKQVVAEIPSFNLVIIGAGGESERMDKMIKSYNLERNIQCVGRKPFSELPRYLNASDIMVVPSVWVEHFGQVTIEAMACAVPVITTNIGGSPEINIDNQTGLVVPPKSSSALAEAMVKLLRNEELRSRFAKAARQRVIENYSYEVLTNKFINLIRDVN